MLAVEVLKQESVPVFDRKDWQSRVERTRRSVVIVIGQMIIHQAITMPRFLLSSPLSTRHRQPVSPSHGSQVLLELARPRVEPSEAEEEEELPR